MTTELVWITTNSSNIENGNESILLDHEHDFSPVMLLVTVIVATFTAFIGTTGNLLTILALLASRKLRQVRSTYFIINLAVVEFLFTIVFLPINALHYSHLYLYNESFFSDESCNLFTTLRYTITQAELQTILGIGLTRMIVIRWPKLSLLMNKKYVMAIHISLIWIYSLCMRLPLTLGPLINNRYGYYAFNSAMKECGVGEDSLVAMQVLQIVELVCPMVLITVSYIVIFATVKQSTKLVTQASRQGDDGCQFHPNKRYTIAGQISNRDYRVARAIFIIFIILVICTIPIGICHRKDFAQKFPNTFLGLHFLYWIQYCVNPLVYVRENPSYRRAFKQLISRIFPCCCKFVEDHSSVSNKILGLRTFEQRKILERNMSRSYPSHAESKT